MKKFRRVLLYTFLLTVIVCGIAFAMSVSKRIPQEVGIHGTVTRDGKPLEWKVGQRRLSVIFVPVDREKAFRIYPAECDANKGTFSIAKMPVGVYTVMIRKGDSLPNQDLPDSTLKREVAHDGQEILIDLPADKPEPQ